MTTAGANVVGPDDPRVPSLSVVIPAYNSARTIERCLAALRAQEGDAAFEVIVVDSGTDGTADLARRAMPEARIIRLPARAVAAAARNAGARAARAEVFAFIDSDAYADPAWVQSALDAAGQGFDLVCGSVDNANARSAVARAEQLLMFNEFLPDLPPGPSWFALSGNMVITRAAFARFGEFLSLRAAEDVVYSRRLIAAGGRVLFYPAMRVFHDNRTRIWPFLRNQFVVGKHTLLARTMVQFADTSRVWPFVLALPVLPLAKLAKIGLRMARRGPAQAARLARELPLFFTGACAYSAGIVAGLAAVARRTGSP